MRIGVAVTGAGEDDLTFVVEAERLGADSVWVAEAWGHDNTGFSTDFHTVNEIHTWAGANTRIYLKTRDVQDELFMPAGFIPASELASLPRP